MGTNGGTIISFTSTPSLHAVTSRMPSHPNGCANFTFQLPSIANASKKNTNSAERRANHNAVERARRECLNTKFQELAHALPSLAQVRRPSKSIIVQKSLDFIYTARQKDELHDKEMRSIRSENESLREEINKLREELGLDPLPPREEPKPTTSQTDDAKEDANKNTPEIKAEADIPTTTTAHEPKSSTDFQIKPEDSRSDDDYSNGNTDDDYEQDPSETTIDGKNVEADQTKQHIENQPCLYDGLVYLDTSMNHHTGYPPSDFDFPMDMTSMDHLVDANSLNLNFDDSLNAHEMGTFCGSFPIQQKYYPSPPYEAAMIDLSGHIPLLGIAEFNTAICIEELLKIWVTPPFPIPHNLSFDFVIRLIVYLQKTPPL
ncbi:16029_t:CDS:2, partial [Acaulospora morrowiae]